MPEIRMDKSSAEEIMELKQKLVELMKENNEMKELILFLDDERNYARQIVRDFNSKQSLNWNSLKQKLSFLEQKQFELIKENYSLKQLCVMLDENSNCPPAAMLVPPATTNGQQQRNVSAKQSLAICQHLQHLESELRLRGLHVPRPKYVADVLKIHALREQPPAGATTNEERIIFDSISEMAIKSIFNR